MYSEFIDKFYKDEMTSLQHARFRALLNSLDNVEICSFTYESIDGMLLLKERLKFYEVLVNRTNINWEECFTQLISRILSSIYREQGWRRQRLGIIMSYLSTSNNLPLKLKDDIIKYFIASRLISERKRAYEIIDESAILQFGDEVLNNWNMYGDYGALSVLIHYLPQGKLNTLYDKLLSYLLLEQDYEYRLLERQLYRRSTMNSIRLNALKKRDGITYAYTLLHHNRNLSETEALDLWDNYKDADKASILLWAFGQMRLWNLLFNLHLPGDD